MAINKVYFERSVSSSNSLCVASSKIGKTVSASRSGDRGPGHSLQCLCACFRERLTVMPGPLILVCLLVCCLSLIRHYLDKQCCVGWLICSVVQSRMHAPLQQPGPMGGLGFCPLRSFWNSKET